PRSPCKRPAACPPTLLPSLRGPLLASSAASSTVPVAWIWHSLATQNLINGGYYTPTPPPYDTVSSGFSIRCQLVVRFQHSHPTAATAFANVGIKGPLANIGFQWSFGFDIRFARLRREGSECQIHSTGQLRRRWGDRVHVAQKAQRAFY